MVIGGTLSAAGLMGAGDQAAIRTSRSSGLAAPSGARVVRAKPQRVASAANATQAHSAGWKPAVKPAGVPRWPRAEKTALPIAIAKTAPKRWAITLMPDALPISSGATASRI